MARQKAKHIALSYSRLSTYEQCPLKFFRQYIEKSYPDEGENFHFIKGKKKHTQLENYIKCKNDPTMINMMYDGDVLNNISKVDDLLNNGFNVTAEHQLAVDIDFKPTSWFDHTVVYRAICDMIATRDADGVVGDWKTGKFRDYDGSKTGQLHLSSAVVFAHYPQIEKITTAYIYIEHDQSVVRRFTRDMYNSGLIDPFMKAFETVNNDKEWLPTRNQYCNWCLVKEDCPIFKA